VIAFLPTLGPQELCLLLVIGLLLIAHELPETGRSMGRLPRE
jgi:Sec-independent protein translocase protein TatA